MKSLPVRVIPNFLTSVECAAWIDYINELERSRPQDFTKYESSEGYRLALQFGEQVDARRTLDDIPEKELEARRIFSRIVKETGAAFDDINEIFVSTFWLAKQYPGSVIHFHEDTDGGVDSHIVYSSLVYLNSQADGGELRFPRFDYTYKPQAGDLVVFDTQQAGMHGVMRIHEERYSLPVWMTRAPSFKL